MRIHSDEKQKLPIQIQTFVKVRSKNSEKIAKLWIKLGQNYCFSSYLNASKIGSELWVYRQITKNYESEHPPIFPTFFKKQADGNHMKLSFRTDSDGQQVQNWCFYAKNSTLEVENVERSVFMLTEKKRIENKNDHGSVFIFSDCPNQSFQRIQ